MRRLLLIFFSLVFFLSVLPVYAAERTVYDTKFEPKYAASYGWATTGGEKFATFQGVYLYRVYDGGTYWKPVVVTQNVKTSIFLCDIYASTNNNDFSKCILVESGQVVAKNMANLKDGYNIVFAYIDGAPDPEPEPEPTIAIYPASGEFDDSVDVVITSNVGTILYSLDGSEPSLSYSSTLKITETTTVKAKAINKKGKQSAVVSATYTKKLVQPTIVFNPSATSFSNPFDMTILSNYEGTQIYYSVDGSPPSVLYKGSVRISKQTTVKAKAVYKGVTSPIYEITYSPAPIQHTDEKFFMMPPMGAEVGKNALDLIKVASPFTWMFAVAFLGLMILAFMKGAFRK